MDEKKRIALWEEYARTKSSKIREKLILEYAGWSRLLPEDWECIWVIL